MRAFRAFVRVASRAPLLRAAALAAGGAVAYGGSSVYASDASSGSTALCVLGCAARLRPAPIRARRALRIISPDRVLLSLS
jgi:hypothetical protein